MRQDDIKKSYHWFPDKDNNQLLHVYVSYRSISEIYFMYTLFLTFSV